MKNRIKCVAVIITVLLSAVTVGCGRTDTINTSSEDSVSSYVSSESVSETSSQAPVTSTEAAQSEPSSETVSSMPASSEETSSETAASKEMSSQTVSSDKQPVSSNVLSSSQPQSSVKDKPEASSSESTNSKPASSNPVQEPASSESPNFGERMDEAEVDRIIAEGIEYAESKGMTWYEDFSVEGSGYYNPAFSGAGAEIFKRDLFYHIDQVYDISVNDPYYKEGNGIAYKIVKGEFEEPGYWYGFVLY